MARSRWPSICSTDIDGNRHQRSKQMPKVMNISQTARPDLAREMSHALLSTGLRDGARRLQEVRIEGNGTSSIASVNEHGGAKVEVKKWWTGQTRAASLAVRNKQESRRELNENAWKAVQRMQGSSHCRTKIAVHTQQLQPAKSQCWRSTEAADPIPASERNPTLVAPRHQTSKDWKAHKPLFSSPWRGGGAALHLNTSTFDDHSKRNETCMHPCDVGFTLDWARAPSQQNPSAIVSRLLPFRESSPSLAIARCGVNEKLAEQSEGAQTRGEHPRQ